MKRHFLSSKQNNNTGGDCKVKILVCYYQPWPLPIENIFFPIQAGKAISSFNLEMQGDDTGDNISDKNKTFGEFTAWYWAWKNIKKLFPALEYVGLSHYRRYFNLHEPFEDDILMHKIHKKNIPEMNNYENQVIQRLENNDIILVKLAPFSSDLKTQYELWHYASDYSCMKDIIHEMYPQYDESFSYFFEKNNKISLYCMFIAKYELFNKYFEWLFPLLFEAEKRIDVSKHEAHQKRVFAFLAERLLNIYVYHNKLKVVYEPVFFIEGKRNIGIELRHKLKEIIKPILPYGIIKWYKRQR